MNTIKDQWNFFSSTVISKSAPPLQRSEMQIAFYCGAESVLRVMFNAGDHSVSEDAGIAILEGMHQECRQFAREHGTSKGLPQPLIDLIAPTEKRGPVS